MNELEGRWVLVEFRRSTQHHRVGDVARLPIAEAKPLLESGVVVHGRLVEALPIRHG